MSYLKIAIDTTGISASELDRLSSYDQKESLKALEKLLQNINGGSALTASAIAIKVDKNPIQATALVSIDGEVSNDDNISINGVTFTAKASPSGEVQFKSDADPAISAASLVSKINACTNAKITSITASNASGEVTLTVDEYGAVGNGFKLLKTTGENITVEDFSATGHVGTDGTSYTFNN